MVHDSSNHQFDLCCALIYCVLLSAVWWLIPHPIWGPALAMLPIVVMLVIARPFEMVLLFVVFSFFRIHEVIPVLYPLKIPLMLSLAAIASLIWHITISHKITLWWNRELTLLTYFFVLVFIGVAMASNRSLALTYFNDIFCKIALMTYAIIWITRTERDFSLASTLLTSSGTLVGIVALLNKANHVGLVEGTRVTIGRTMGSVLGDPNDLALVLMFPAAFSLSLITTNNIATWQRWLGYVSLPILFFAVLATQSRGGLLGIMAVFGVFIYRKINNKLAFIALVLIASILLYTVAGISERSSGGAAEQGLDASAQGRLFAWQAAWRMALHNPITGVGIDNYYANYFFYSQHWDGLNHAVHSTWFGVLAETGIVGLIVFITLIIALIRMAYQSIVVLQTLDKVPPTIIATAQAVFSGMIGTVVAGTFLTQGFTWPIYILAALILAVSRWTTLAKQLHFAN